MSKKSDPGGGSSSVFEEAIGRLLVEIVAVVDNGDLAMAPRRFDAQLGTELAHESDGKLVAVPQADVALPAVLGVVGRRTARRGTLDAKIVGMRLGVHQQTRRTAVAGGERVAPVFAEKRPGQFLGERRLPMPSGPAKR